jgi:hypothetical protein
LSKSHQSVLLYFKLDVQLTTIYQHMPLLITSCIIPRDERSETICEAVRHALEQKGNNLDEWCVVHERMCDTNHSIPPAAGIGDTLVEA